MAYQILFLPPSHALAEHVLGYVVRRRQISDEVVAAAVVPTIIYPANMYAALTIVHRGHLGDPTGEVITGAIISGAMTQPASRALVDWPETTNVLFKPGRIAEVVQVPADELTDRWVPVDAVLTRADSLELCERMAEQPSLARQIAVLNQLLERRLLCAPRPRGSVATLVEHLMHLLPMMSVHELAQRAGLSERQLNRRVIDALGMSPKLVLRLARLQLALRQLRALARAGRPPSRERFGPLALRAGFADTSHMAREFRSFTGHPPEVLRERLRVPSPNEWAYDLPEDWLGDR
ncbi:AraC family transcriptional regulator [Aquabacterium humicola]|uniref:AraC family transcriptional regulator n=1 Tax=Aquabacterium humicola TaxID=3237377 RepID=UPI002543A9E2|nr:AraC family transcriptional regulator [Rubrivivax pictus]